MRLVTRNLGQAAIAGILRRQAPRAVLPFTARRRSRQRATLDTGEPVGLALGHGAVLRDGDVLLADDGRFIVVQAACERLLRVTAGAPAQLARAAYHLGNRHVLVEIRAGSLLLEHDEVLADMLRRLGGLTLDAVDQPFEPDAGAYGGGHRHGHEESFAQDYALAQAAYVAHDHGHGHPHSHSPGRQ